MATDPTSDLSHFHQFVGEKLRGDAGLTPEEVLSLYRAEHPSDDEDEEIIAMVQEALDDIAAGDKGVSLEEFDREFRRRHNLS